MFFGGANFICKRVLQGPLTLGLHSTTFRSALPAATLPYPGADYIPRKPRSCCFAFFCLRRLQPTLAFAGCSLRFYLFQYPCAVLYTAQTALLLFPLTSVFVGYNRRWLLPSALSGFTCSSTLRSPFKKNNQLKI